MAGECHNNVLYVDRSLTVGVSKGDDGRGELHTNSAVRGQRGTTTPGTGSPASTTSTVAAVENLLRKYLFIQNVSNGELWIDFTIDAVTDAPSIRLSPGDVFLMESNFITTEVVNIIRKAGSGDYTLKEG